LHPDRPQVYNNKLNHYHPFSKMVKLIPYIASLLALGQAAVAAKAVTSFSEWVDGILENPNGDNMTPEEVVNAYQSGQFEAPAGKSTIHQTMC
jgi:hypothetical protein